MESEVQHKLLSHEVAPPAGAWTAIEAALDEWSALATLRTPLETVSVSPPSATWNTIASNLDNADAFASIGAELYSIEMTPPAGSWENIASGLALTPSYTVTRKRGFIRFAVAAAVIGIVAFGGWKLLSSNQQSPRTAATDVKTNPPDEKTTITVAPDERDRVEKVPAQITVAQTTPDPSPQGYAKVDISTRKKLNQASDFRFAGGLNASNGKAYEDFQCSIAERYIVLMTPDGNFIRVSKKLGDLVCCVSGEEQDRDCRDQVERWRKQVACASAAPVSNFGDILNLLSNLQED